VTSHEAGEITDHAAHISSEAEAISGLSARLTADGVGDLLMYGVLVGQIAHPVLSAVASSKSQAIRDLSAVLDSTAESLTTAAELYTDTETSAVEKSRAVQTEIEKIQVPETLS